MLVGLLMLSVSILTSKQEPSELESKVTHLYYRVKELEMDMEIIKDRIDYLEKEDNKAKLHDSIYINENISEDYYV